MRGDESSERWDGDAEALGGRGRRWGIRMAQEDRVCLFETKLT